MTENDRSSQIKLAMGAICISLAPILVKFASAEAPNAIAFYRTFFAFALLFPFRVKSLTTLTYQKSKSFFIFGALAGVAFALDLNVWHRSIYYAGAGIATVLGNTQVFLAGLLGYLIYKERLDLVWFISAIAAVAGVALISGGGLQLTGTNLYKGIAFGLATAPFYALFVFFLRRAQKDLGAHKGIDALTVSLFFAALCAFMFCLFENASLILTPKNTVLFFGLATIPQILGWGLISQNVSKVPLSLSGMILLLQPVFAVVISYFLFGEKLTAAQGLGAVIILVSVYICGTKKRGLSVAKSSS